MDSIDEYLLNFDDISFDIEHIYVDVDNLKEIKRLNEFKSALLVAIDQNSKLRHLTNDNNYQSILHYMNEKNRAKVKTIDEMLAKLK